MANYLYDVDFIIGEVKGGQGTMNITARNTSLMSWMFVIVGTLFLCVPPAAAGNGMGRFSSTIFNGFSAS